MTKARQVQKWAHRDLMRTPKNPSKERTTKSAQLAAAPV
jgi:hypothetical protein